MFKHLITLILIAMLIFIFGCEKDPTGPDENGNGNKKLNGAFIMNEGLYGQSNGSLSFYSFEENKVYNNIFKAANNRSLGDVVNSMTLHDTLGFIIVNNSNKIEVISTNTWKSVVTINLPAGSSPRHLVIDDNNRAYVTNLFANSVSVINLNNYQIEKTIAVGANPEEIIIAQGKAYVANSGFGQANTVSVIDLSMLEVIKNIKVGDNPIYLEIDNDDEINVLCQGRWPSWTDTTDKGTDGGLYVIDPSADVVVDSLNLSGHPAGLTLDGNGTGFFIGSTGVVSYSTETNEIIDNQLISDIFYDMEADPVTQQIFALDAVDFTQSGTLHIYDFQGNLQSSFTVGLIPGAVTFIYE